MDNINSGKIQHLRTEIKEKRQHWQAIRHERLQRKSDIERCNIKIVRKDKIYLRLKKRQKQLSKEIRHLVRKLNKALANSGKSR